MACRVHRGVVAFPGVHLDGTPAARVGGLHRDLHLDAAALGDDQRRVRGQLVEQTGADLVAGVDGEFDQAGAGEHDGAADGVVGEPRVGGRDQRPVKTTPSVLASGTAASSSGWVAASSPAPTRAGS